MTRNNVYTSWFTLLLTRRPEYPSAPNYPILRYAPTLSLASSILCKVALDTCFHVFGYLKIHTSCWSCLYRIKQQLLWFIAGARWIYYLLHKQNMFHSSSSHVAIMCVQSMLVHIMSLHLFHCVLVVSTCVHMYMLSCCM